MNSELNSTSLNQNSSQGNGEKINSNPLRHKNSKLLVIELKSLVRQEKQTTFQILDYLREIESRRLYLSLGYPSLFAFCLHDLQYSEPEANIRISAMRLFRSVPEAERRIKSGEINLSQAALMQSTFRREEILRREEKRNPLLNEEKSKLVELVAGKSYRESQQLLANSMPVASQKEYVKPINAEFQRLEVTVSRKAIAKINELRALVAHQIPSGDTGKVLELALEVALKVIAKNKGLKSSSGFTAISGMKSTDKMAEEKPVVHPEQKIHQKAALSNQPNGRNLGPIPPRMYKVSRYIPAEVKQAIWRRDQGRCQFRAEGTNRVCGSRYAIEIDHKMPFSWNGDSGIDNLQLLCRQHNNYKGSRPIT
jgi:5-methylcytosine-specific restriction endonuclease McrA